MNFSTLQSRVGDNLDRTDLTTRIKGWINDERKSLAIDYNFDFLYVEATVTTSAGSGTYALPEDYLEKETLHLGSKKLHALTGKEFDELIGIKETLDSSTNLLVTTNSNITTGEPDYYINRGLYFDLYPIPNGSYTLTLKYYAQPIDFSGNTDEDYMSRIYFDAIIYGATMRGSAFLDDDKKLSTYAGLYSKALQSMEKKERGKKGNDLRRRMKTYKDFDLETFKRLIKAVT